MGFSSFSLLVTTESDMIFCSVSTCLPKRGHQMVYSYFWQVICILVNVRVHSLYFLSFEVSRGWLDGVRGHIVCLMKLIRTSLVVNWDKADTIYEIKSLSIHFKQNLNHVIKVLKFKRLHDLRKMQMYKLFKQLLYYPFCSLYLL